MSSKSDHDALNDSAERKPLCSTATSHPVSQELGGKKETDHCDRQNTTRPNDAAYEVRPDQQSIEVRKAAKQFGLISSSSAVELAALCLLEEQERAYEAQVLSNYALSVRLIEQVDLPYHMISPLPEVIPPGPKFDNHSKPSQHTHSQRLLSTSQQRQSDLTNCSKIPTKNRHSTRTTSRMAPK
ncbi:hypothetical protein PYCC9005_003474 [Savitreella phatthalungensis]